MIEYFVDPMNLFPAYAFETLDEAIQYAKECEAPQIDVIDGETGEVQDFLYQSYNWRAAV